MPVARGLRVGGTAMRLCQPVGGRNNEIYPPRPEHVVHAAPDPALGGVDHIPVGLAVYQDRAYLGQRKSPPLLGHPLRGSGIRGAPGTAAPH